VLSRRTALIVLFSGAVVSGCGSSPEATTTAPASAAEAEPPATTEPPEPPAAPRAAVLRPTFDTTEGSVSAGTSFLVSWDDGRTLMLTANHLFGEAGGMSRTYTAAELPQTVSAVTAVAADDEAVTVTSDQFIDLPQAAPSSVNVGRDLSAFLVDEAAGAHVFTLAHDRPAVDQPVYLLAQARGAADPRLYPARVKDTGEAGAQRLYFGFDPSSGMTDEKMSGTSGGPVLDSSGAVVGILVAGGDDDGEVWAVANSVTSIRPMLTAALQ
jgi:hypothetical protein